MVVVMLLEPLIEPHFHQDSYGYRKGKSAHGISNYTKGAIAQSCLWCVVGEEMDRDLNFLLPAQLFFADIKMQLCFHLPTLVFRGIKGSINSS